MSIFSQIYGTVLCFRDILDGFVWQRADCGRRGRALLTGELIGERDLKAEKQRDIAAELLCYVSRVYVGMLFDSP